MSKSLIHIHIPLIVANCLLGLNFSLYKSIIGSGVDFQLLFYMRVLFSSLIFMPFILTRSRYYVNFEDILRLMLAMVLMIFGKQYLMLWGALYTTPVNGAIIATLAPVLTLSISMMVGRTKGHIFKVVGISFGVSAMLVLLLFDSSNDKSTISFGNILLLFSTISSAINTLLIKPALVKLGVARSMGWYYIFAMIVTTPFFFHDLLSFDFRRLDIVVLSEILWVVLFGTILPNFLLYYATTRAESEQSAIYSYFQPLTTTVVVYLRAQQHISIPTFVAAILIIIAITFVEFDRNLMRKKFVKD